MKYIYYILKTKLFYLIFAIQLIIVVILSLLFNGNINKIYDYKVTIENTTSDYMAIDSRKFDTNCYIYYDTNVKIHLENKIDSEILPVEVYQFINNVTYDDMSLLNEKNIFRGVYSELLDGEIAISKKTSMLFNKEINDIFYINGKYPTKIKYIFNDFYDIKSANINDYSSVVFLGMTNKPYSQYKYAYFSDKNNLYNSIYIFDKNIKKLDFQLYLIYAIIGFLIIICQLFIFKYMFNYETSALKKIILSGSGNQLKYIVLIELTYTCIPLIISSLFSLFFSIHLFLYIILVMLILFLVKSVILICYFK